MKLIIFGATGTVGKHLVDQGLDLGHSVTAFTRNPQKITRHHSQLSIMQGDVLDFDIVKNTVEGHDAVLCTLGAGRKGELRAKGTATIIKAMTELGIDRLICQTTLGCGESWNNLNFFWRRIMFGWFLKQAFIDHENQEEEVSNSNLDWTLVRPSAFTDGELTKQFEMGFSPEEQSLKLKIARADVACFMLAQIDSPKYIRKAVGISN